MKKDKTDRKYKKARFRGGKINRSLGADIVIFAGLIVFGCFMALPLVYAIGNSLKPLNELWVFPPMLIPRHPTFQNFIDLFSLLQNSWVPISRYFFNTLFITLVGTAGQVIFASACAYPLAKHKFPGHNFIFSMIVLSLMFSTVVTSIPNYIIMTELNWIDRYVAIIIPAMGNSLGLYLMKQNIETLPDSLLEAAKIDGANEFVIYWKIVMPNVKAAWLTLIVFSVQQLWNTGSNIFIYSEQLKTLPYAISQILAGGIARAGVGSAVTVIMMFVPIAVFVFTQSSIVETMASSGMKD